MKTITKMLALILLCLLLVPLAVSAQSVDVYVTTQDNSALRAGPGTIWERLAVLDFGTTYHAIGRTIDGDWIQIAYEGDLEPGARTDFTRDGITYGWVASRLLIWTGNILELPIDGVVSVPIARAAGPTIVIGPDTYVYEGVIDPSTRVPSPVSSPATVEVTGRLGAQEAGYFWLQFKISGKFYWTGSWEVGVPRGYIQLPDASYLFPYSRLSALLLRNVRQANTTLGDIGGRWRALDTGRPTTCNDIPDDLELIGFNDSDLNIEPEFAPVAIGLIEAQNNINDALDQFRSACADSNRQLSAGVINTALISVESAQRNLTLLSNLIIPYQRRDPILGNEPTSEAAS